MKRKADDRNKRIERGILLAWSSLESHLQWTYKKSSEGKRFHQKCVAEYIELIKILSEMF